MRIKLDENFDHRLATEIRRLGHEVDTVLDEQLASRPDDEIAAAAHRENRTLFTLDLDFSDNRRFPPGRHAGIVIFRPHVYRMPIIRSMLFNFLGSSDALEVEGAIAIVEPSRTRIRHPEPHDDPKQGPAEAWEQLPRGKPD